MMRKILFLMVFVFLFSCSKGGGDWVAKIEGQDPITLKEFDQYIDMVAKLNLSEGEAALKKQEPEFRKAALDNLIANKIILKEMEKTDVIKPEFVEVFQMQALSKYFILKNVQPKVDFPADSMIQAQYEKYKGELAKRGITDPAQAKKVIVNEYQKAKYMQILMDEMKKVKGEYRKTLNDEFEQNWIEQYAKNKLKEDYKKAWLFKIEGKEYSAAEVDKFISAMVDINYGKDGLERYQKDDKFKENVRGQIFQDYFAAVLILTDAQTKGWLNQDEVRNFVNMFINNEKVKYFMRVKISPTLEKPSEQDVKAYYDRFQKDIKKPYAEVKELLTYRIFSERAEVKAMKYIEKIKDGKKIEINSKYFETKKENKEPEKK